MMVHLVLTALGAVAVETQGLVGHQLLAARVDGSADGNTRIMAVSIAHKLSCLAEQIGENSGKGSGVEREIV